MSQPCMQRRSRGFTLLESVVAVTILGIAMVGALTGLIAATKQLRDGSTRQFREQLLDASAQRWRLASKAALTSLPAYNPSPLNTVCSAACDTLAIGASPWMPDPTQGAGFVAGDLSTGAYFTIALDGTLTQLTGTYTGCNDAALPANAFCREMLVTQGAWPIVAAGQGWSSWPPTPPAGAYSVGGGQTVLTLWVRVSAKGAPASSAVFFAESRIQ